MNARVDLHTHTTASDGSLAPAELIQAAAAAGLAAVAVTDHDITAGLAPALAAGTALDIEVVPGVEVSAEYKPGQMHILGLFIDPQSVALNGWLAEVLDGRNGRNVKIVARLLELGVEITLDEVEAEAGGGAVGRPHIAQVLLDNGAVSSRQEAFDRYLARGAAAYFDRPRATPVRTIENIHAGGGLAVLAHCNSLGANDAAELEQAIRGLKDQGLDGLEIRHPSFSPERQATVEAIARKLDLLPSGGSDFHGKAKPQVKLGVGRGKLHVPYAFLEKLKEALARRVA